MLPYLGIEMQSRGRDGWGASDGERIFKRKGPIIETWGEVADDISGWGQGIFHTRGASLGTAKEEENAHPFAFPKADGSSVIGIHNGLISNHTELDAKYGRKCEVDSEHIWMHRAAGLPWSDLGGWGNLAWWETDEGERRLNLARFNTDSLKVCRLKQGEYIFCSESKPITVISTMLGNPPETWFTIDERHHYYFKREPEAPGGVRLMRSGELLEFAKLPPPKPSYGCPTGGTPFVHDPNSFSRSHYNPAMNYCLKCNTTRVSNDDVLCFTCLRFYMDMYATCGLEDWIA